MTNPIRQYRIQNRKQETGSPNAFYRRFYGGVKALNDFNYFGMLLGMSQIPQLIFSRPLFFLFVKRLVPIYGSSRVERRSVSYQKVQSSKSVFNTIYYRRIFCLSHWYIQCVYRTRHRAIEVESFLVEKFIPLCLN